ncbi:MAG: hypothetical protein JW839_02865 [Candidatus Lokiarchaeota archaeon]|nr:hypothetical protein [Candidatus Lokiarchaeota archaeon]
MCGKTDSFGAGDDDLFLLKYAANGTLLWSRTWGPHDHASRDDEGTGVVCDPAGNVYTCGSTVPAMGAMSDMLLVKWAPDGTQLWNRTWGVTNPISYAEYGKAMTLTPGGDVYFYGCHFHGSLPYTAITRWGPGGDLLSARVADTYNWDVQEYVENAPATASASCLYSLAHSSTWQDVLVSRWYANGTRQWHETIPFPDEDTQRSIIVTTMETILLSGVNAQPPPIDYRAFLIKMDGEGQILWNVTWAESQIRSIAGLQEFDRDCVLATYYSNIDGWHVAQINVTAIEAQWLDSDNDTLSDYDEAHVHGTSPHSADTDGDGLGDYHEVFLHGTDPTSADTDGDGASDLEEVHGGTDPLDPGDNPASRMANTIALAVGIPAAVAAGVLAIAVARRRLPAARKRWAAAAAARRARAGCPGCTVPPRGAPDAVPAGRLCEKCEARLDDDERRLLGASRRVPRAARPAPLRALLAPVPSQLAASAAAREAGGAPGPVNFAFDAETRAGAGDGWRPAMVLVSRDSMVVHDGERRTVIPFGRVAAIDDKPGGFVVTGRPTSGGKGAPRVLHVRVIDDDLDAPLVARRLRLHLAIASKPAPGEP